MAWVVLAGPALAVVRVQDPSACVPREALDLEIRDALGDVAVDGLDLYVGVTATGEARDLELRVSDARGSLLWQKALAAQSGDCPLLPELISRSVEAGLALVPGWRIRAERGRSRPEGIVWARLSGPAVFRAGLGGGVLAPVIGPGWWSVAADGYATPFAPIGSGVFQLGAIGLTTGPSVRFRAGREAVDLSARAWLGGLGVFGRSFDLERTTLLPHASVDPELLIVTRAAIRVGLRAEIPLTRISLSAPGQPKPSDEPNLRMGLVLALGGALGSGEAPAAGRP